MSMQRQSACSSTRWRSIRNPLRHRSYWQFARGPRDRWNDRHGRGRPHTAEGLVGQALATSPRNAFAHLVKGRVLRAQNRWEEAIPEFEMALALNRNSAAALQCLAQCKLLAGAIEEVIPLEEQAIRLSPRDPSLAGGTS